MINEIKKLQKHDNIAVNQKLDKELYLRFRKYCKTHKIKIKDAMEYGIEKFLEDAQKKSA